MSHSGRPLGGPALGGPALGGPARGGPAPGVTPPGGPADAGRPGTTAGNGGTRGSGRHGAARGSSGGNSPVSGERGRRRFFPGPGGRRPGAADADARFRAPAERGARTRGRPVIRPGNQPRSRPANCPWMDAPGSGQNRMVSATPRLPGGRRRAGRRFGWRPGCGRPGCRSGLGAGETGAGGSGTPRARRGRAGPAGCWYRRPWPVHDRLRAGPAPPQEPEPVPRPGRAAREGWRVRPPAGPPRMPRTRGRCTPGTRPTRRRPSPRSRHGEDSRPG